MLSSIIAILSVSIAMYALMKLADKLFAYLHRDRVNSSLTSEDTWGASYANYELGGDLHAGIVGSAIDSISHH